MQPQFLEIYRAGLKGAADMMSASLETVHRLQQQQLDIVHTAVEDQAKATRELSEARSVEELVALQTRLTGAQMERMMDFWNRMWRAVGDAQGPIISQAQAQFGQVREAAQQEQRKHERKTA